MCVSLPPRDLNPNPYPLTPQMWSDHRTKNVQWLLIINSSNDIFGRL